MKNISTKQLFYYISSFVLVFLAISAAVLSRESREIIDTFFNSDFVMMHYIYRDVVEMGNSFADWSISSAPTFFPDLTMLSLYNWIFGDFRTATAANALIQFTLFLTLLQLLARTLITDSKKRVGVGTAINLVAAGYFLFAAFYRVPGWLMFNYALGHSAHFGNVLLTLGAVIILLSYIRKKSFIKICSLLILGILALVSNRFFAFSFILPVLAALLLDEISVANFSRLKILHNVRRHKTLTLIVGSIAVIGVALIPIVAQFVAIQGKPITPRIILEIGRSVLLFTLYTFSNSTTLFYTLFVVFIGFVTWRLYVHYSDKVTRLYFRWFALTSLSLIAAPIALGLYVDFSNSRYSFLIYFVGILHIALWLRLQFQKSDSIWKYGLISFFILSVLTTAVHRVITYNEYSQLKDLYPAETACLDQLARERNLEQGLAGFWNAEHNTMFSKENLTILQIEKDTAEIMIWNNTTSPYEFTDEASQTINYAAYDFVMIRDLDIAPLKEKMGEPVEVVQCEDDFGNLEEVWVYKE